MKVFWSQPQVAVGGTAVFSSALEFAGSLLYNSMFSISQKVKSSC